LWQHSPSSLFPSILKEPQNPVLKIKPVPKLAKPGVS
jgi:hypothetical protein